MAIATLANYNAAKKQQVAFKNTATFTIAATTWFSMFKGTLAGANTANGVVPTIADWLVTDSNKYLQDSHAPDAFGGGTTGYLTKLKGYAGQSGIVALHDCLFKAGAYSFNSAVTLSSQPSFSGRMPGGTDYTNTELWFECVTAFTGVATVTVTYTNDAGTAGRTTDLTVYNSTPTVRRLLRFPLQSGDTGVQKIESVTSTVATVGTFNILILRKLASTRIQQRTTHGSNALSMPQDMIKLGMPVVFADMCPFIMIMGDLSSSATEELIMEFASG